MWCIRKNAFNYISFSETIYHEIKYNFFIDVMIRNEYIKLCFNKYYIGCTFRLDIGLFFIKKGCCWMFNTRTINLI